ncbi:MAG TPA: carboxymuconolactone decarboxylase family protein [Mycobacteriales bacterium]|nr:carboxymuconolactone decarboxylase family protein [Mycobacteriales bacterium]
MTEDRHERGLRKMGEVYAWKSVPDLPSEFFKLTADHLFGDIWNREGLSLRDRRMLLLGVVAALGEWAVLPIQLDAILANEELTPDQLREVTIFLTHYVGWPKGSTMNNVVEERVAAHRKRGEKPDFPGPSGPGR